MVLGDLRLEAADGVVLRRRRKELALLTWIALRSGPVRREELAAAFWGDTDDAHARQSLRQAVASIRKAAPDVLEMDGETIAIATGTLTVDLLELERLAAAGDRASAVAMWRGDLLPAAEDFGAEPYRTWLEGERSRLGARLGGLLQRLASEASTAADQLRWSERWTELMPLDERAHLHLLGALERAGRIGDALERHAVFASRYRAEREREMPDAVREAVELLHQRDAGASGHQPGSAAFFTPDLTGRDAEFAALRAAWHDARRGAGVTVLIEGESGAGRTRLGVELIRSVASGSRLVVLEVPRECDGNATSPERRFLAPLATARGVAAAAPWALVELAAVVPEIADGRALPSRGTGGDLAAAVREVVASVAEENPLLVFVDDAPELCESLRPMVAQLVRRPPSNVLVVLTAESGRLAATECGRAFREAADARRLKLQPLDPAQVEVMIASMVPMPAADRQRLATMLMGETDGNPLRITDCISAFADGGVLAVDQNGMWRLSKGRGPGSLPLPPSVLRTRLERLSQEARRTLEAAARRPSAEAQELMALAQLDEEEVEAALGELVGRRLLRPIRDSARYEVASEPVRSAVLAEAPPSVAPVLKGWRRRRRLAVAGIAVLSLGVAGLAARWAMPASAAPAPDRVIVFPFENASGEPDRAGTGRLAAEAVIQAVGRTGAGNAVPLVAAPGAATPERVRSMAAASGAAFVVLGNWREEADSLVFSARLLDVRSGETRSVGRETAGPAERPGAAVAPLAEAVVGALAARLDHRIAAAALAGSIPPSHAVYHRFAEGLDHLYAREGDRANAAFFATYHQDTTFLLPLIYAAFSHLGQARFSRVDSLAEVLQERRAELTPYEQATLDFLRVETSADVAARYAAARRAAELAPGSMMAGYYFPRAAIALNRPREAIVALDAVDPERDEIAGMPGYWSMLSMALHMAGDYERQLAIGRAVEARFPKDTRGLNYQVRALAALGRLDSLEAVLTRGFSVATAPGWDAHGLSLHLLAFNELRAHGHGERAAGLLSRAVAHYERAPDSLRNVRRQRLEMGRALYSLGRLPEARSLASGLLAERGMSAEMLVATLELLGVTAAAAGDVTAADSAEHRLAQAGSRYAFGMHTEARAHIAAALGRQEEAVRLLHQAMTEGRAFDNNKHLDPELLLLRDYAPFVEWLRPKG